MYAPCVDWLTMTTELPALARQLRRNDSYEFPEWKLA
jgi:hypothetical protein